MIGEYNWDISNAERNLQRAFLNNSETDLLSILKDNAFLFYELFSRKYSVQPIFREITFGSKYRCDFAWLNENSDGPEWVLVEIEKPKMKLFTTTKKPSMELNSAIEQVKSWARYFKENPLEKKRIFGAVSKFRFILVAGNKNDWESENAILWRSYHNANSEIEIRSTDIFTRAIHKIKTNKEEFWCFDEYPKTEKALNLENYWKNNEYMKSMRHLF
jgi:hypothetical protein